ncbi:MAG: DUF1801 domain-containing protein [Kouleothrix sp.]|jgi:hypothetical protein|nr:DUF1801 domain-containing protein [Kouleothrix sp.]
MAEPKTKPNDLDVEGFLNGVANQQQRQDCDAIVALMREATGATPRMWGASIVGFGSYHYRYASGHEGDSPLVGFSPRKQNTTLYLAYGLEQQEDLLQRLGKHKIGKGCLYIKRLADVDQAVLRELIARSVEQLIHANPPAAEG